jgi:hypothetical protein
MTTPPLLLAAAEAIRASNTIGKSACLIGGLAVQRWGQPRVTQDVDLTLLVPIGSEASVVDALLQYLKRRHAEARRFALDRRVLLCVASNGVDVDISLAGLPFEEEVLQRASRWRQVDGVWLDTCSAEDLIIYKLVAARPQDLADVHSVVLRQRNKLDVERVRAWGREFADLKEDPDLLRPFERSLQGLDRLG